MAVAIIYNVSTISLSERQREYATLRVMGIVLAGVGNAGWAPALYTMPMEFEGMPPERVGVIFSVMLSMGYLAAFISPIVGGAIAEWAGLQATIAIFALFALAAAVCTFRMRETRPGTGA